MPFFFCESLDFWELLRYNTVITEYEYAVLSLRGRFNREEGKRIVPYCHAASATVRTPCAFHCEKWEEG